VRTGVSYLLDESHAKEDASQDSNPDFPLVNRYGCEPPRLYLRFSDVAYQLDWSTAVKGQAVGDRLQVQRAPHSSAAEKACAPDGLVRGKATRTQRR